MNKSFSYVMTTTTLSVFVDGVSYAIYVDKLNNVLKDELKHALRSKDKDTILMFVDKVKRLTLYSKGHCEIKGGQLFFNGELMHDYLAKKILAMYENGHPIEAYLLFYEKVMKNISMHVREQLFKFMEYGNIPINEKGNVIAYKYVNTNYMDCHSGTFDNHPGNILRMPRHLVCDDPNQGCAAGLNVSPIAA